MKRNNSTFKEKAALRRVMLRQMSEPPVVLETHGGLGRLWAACYAGLGTGVVFEKDEDKAAYLARQRSTWAVYEADCVAALAGGAGAHLEVNVLDLDPWGEPWPAVTAFFESERPRAGRLWVVVNDGLRKSLMQGGAWRVQSLQEAVQKYGNDLFTCYLDVCRELLTQKAAQAGYSLGRFAGYYCGDSNAVTHYLAQFSR